MTPIFVRPVREQMEHDRVIRALQSRLRRRFDVGINAGEEKNVPIRLGAGTVYPDLVLKTTGQGRRLAAVIEVETTESVNNLEAIAQWSQFGRLRVPFHLYAPVGSVDMARRLCADNQVRVAEIWSFHIMGEQVHFTMVHRAPAAAAGRPSATRGPARAKPSRAKAASRGRSSRRPTSRTSRPKGR